uniref:ARGOS-like protein n=1 Tax=Chenopodium quinoa TaxID=63459 RepID=A0A803KTZ0_CHEQI
MEARVRKNVTSTMRETSNANMRNTYSTPMNAGMMGRDRDYHRSFSQGTGKKALRGGYFGLESMFLLVCLTASLLILPLILPPLPPPPFLLLLVPIGILGLLIMILAFMPSNIKNLTYM